MWPCHACAATSWRHASLSSRPRCPSSSSPATTQVRHPTPGPSAPNRWRSRTCSAPCARCSMADVAQVTEQSRDVAIRVLIVDDHAMFAESLARLLGDEEGIEVVGVAENSAHGLELVDRLSPKVVLL